MAFDHLRDVFFRSQADNGFGQLSFLEEQQRGNAAHGISPGHIRVLVDVQLGNGRTPVELRRQCVNRRR